MPPWICKDRVDAFVLGFWLQTCVSMCFMSWVQTFFVTNSFVGCKHICLSCAWRNAFGIWKHQAQTLPMFEKMLKKHQRWSYRWVDPWEASCWRLWEDRCALVLTWSGFPRRSDLEWSWMRLDVEQPDVSKMVAVQGSIVGERMSQRRNISNPLEAQGVLLLQGGLWPSASRGLRGGHAEEPGLLCWGTAELHSFGVKN